MNTTRTITLDEAISRTWDVIVVGAGPAGAVVARELAMQGVVTLLVERHAWPRQKVCGGCLNRRAVLLLQAVGLESVLNASHGIPLTQLTMQAGRRRASVPLTGGMAIDRSAFDFELVNAAACAGAKFLPATKAIVEQVSSHESRSSDVRRVLLSSHGHRNAFATARVVVAADGLGHPSLKRLPEFACRVAEGARVGLSLAIDQMPASYRAGVVYMAISRFGYVGLVRTRGDRGNLAAAIDSSALRSMANPVNAVSAILSDAGFALPDLTTSERWHGTLPLTRHSNRLSAERILLLGDAAGYVEPFTGEGISWALASAAMAAPWIVRNLDHWDARSIGDWENSQRRQMLRGQIMCRLLAGLTRKPLAVRMALAALAVVPSSARSIVQHVC